MLTWFPWEEPFNQTLPPPTLLQQELSASKIRGTSFLGAASNNSSFFWKGIASTTHCIYTNRNMKRHDFSGYLQGLGMCWICRISEAQWCLPSSYDTNPNNCTCFFHANHWIIPSICCLFDPPKMGKLNKFSNPCCYVWGVWEALKLETRPKIYARQVLERWRSQPRKKQHIHPGSLTGGTGRRSLPIGVIGNFSRAFAVKLRGCIVLLRSFWTTTVFTLLSLKFHWATTRLLANVKTGPNDVTLQTRFWLLVDVLIKQE